MTEAEELIAKVRKEFLDGHPNAYTWADGTIDLQIPRSANGFATVIKSMLCPICETKFETSDKKFSQSIIGIKITCPCCGQVWFIHQPISST